ncbi:DnaJ domain-containing protein [Ancylobacter lacus]|uniref:DnaJ domain-containing protein n=1 Tax=Ancylobacter lacus TaxID=2579970 RepID=UPI001BCE5F5A|nr:DnaJ domain-containing protein [Ancylobacter lacus]MBS7540876.1 molecular chaperone DnaJ [Ancylobacter lacus]
MINLLLGALILGGGIYLLKMLGRADPKRLARTLRALGGWASLALAAFLLLKGQVATGLPLGLFGLSLLGWSATRHASGFFRRSRPSPGRASRIRTAQLDMSLDHDSGALSGQVLTGVFAGRALDQLDLMQLIALRRESDEQSRRLLEAYLDRRAPGWREHTQGDPGGRSAAPPRAGAMTEEEAHDVLGLQPGAGVPDITKAHRSLMKKLHPDQGGSNYLAARVNEAKDILMRRHR